MVLRRLGGLLTGTAQVGLAAVRVGARSGLAHPVRPDRLIGMAAGLRKWGISPAAAYAVGAARDPHRLAVIDERESVTYAEIDRRSSVVAAALAERGVGSGQTVGLLARNSSAFVVAQVAIAELGADVLYLNTGFAGPQLRDVLDRENATALVADDEFASLIGGLPLPQLTAWVEDGSEPPDSIAGLVAAAPGRAPALPSPHRESRHIILTSGTTGTPKGASHGVPGSVSAARDGLAVLDAIPYRGRGVTVLAAPAFHAWGLANLVVGMVLQSTLVMPRRFDPTAVLDLIAQHRADTLAAVPVMCQRMLDVPLESDTSSLGLVALSGSALGATLAARFMDTFGDVLYSLYGSTEVAYVSIAGPRDLREAPGTAGRIVRGATVRIVDAGGRDVAPGETGRIFVANALAFEGYTSGEDKPRLGSLASTGDVGRIGPDGRLYVEGRDDDMIVSGGENVFPAEVEEALSQHPDIADVAVLGVPDETFGQALVAHVVLRPGAGAEEAELRAFVGSRLARFKVPRSVVVHDELPRNETGKVLKRELRPPADPPG
jgi:acyl-CoA synthetase (AMP-forming)/AMP-acid ligase II